MWNNNYVIDSIFVLNPEVYTIVISHLKKFNMYLKFT